MAANRVIDDLASLRLWRADIHAVRFLSVLSPAEFRFPNLGDVRNRQLTREAARLHRACGCTAAGLATTVAVAIGAAAIALDPRGAAAIPLHGWAGYLLFVIAAATGGKLAGLLWARREMLRLAGAAEVLIDAGGG